MTGELPVTLAFPQGPDLPSYLSGGHEWRWTAHFEAFASQLRHRPRARSPRRRASTASGSTGSAGRRRRGRALRARLGQLPGGALERDHGGGPARGPGRPTSFRTGPRSARALGELSAEIGPIDYPDSYASPARFVGAHGPACATRPRRTTRPGRVVLRHVLVPALARRGRGRARDLHVRGRRRAARQVDARLEGGRWTAVEPLGASERARVERGAVRDRFGNYNGEGAE